MDVDSVLYILSCISLVLYVLHGHFNKDMDEQILVHLDNYHVLEEMKAIKSTQKR